MSKKFVSHFSIFFAYFFLRFAFAFLGPSLFLCRCNQAKIDEKAFAKMDRKRNRANHKRYSSRSREGKREREKKESNLIFFRFSLLGICIILACFTSCKRNTRLIWSLLRVITTTHSKFIIRTGIRTYDNMAFCTKLRVHTYPQSQSAFLKQIFTLIVECRCLTKWQHHK